MYFHIIISIWKIHGESRFKSILKIIHSTSEVCDSSFSLDLLIARKPKWVHQSHEYEATERTHNKFRKNNKKRKKREIPPPNHVRSSFRTDYSHAYCETRNDTIHHISFLYTAQKHVVVLKFSRLPLRRRADVFPFCRAIHAIIPLPSSIPALFWRTLWTTRSLIKA